MKDKSRKLSIVEFKCVDTIQFYAGRHLWTLYVHLFDDEERYHECEVNGCVVYSSLSVHIPRFKFKNTHSMPSSARLILIHELVHVWENELQDMNDSKEFTNVVAELAVCTCEAIMKTLDVQEMCPPVEDIHWDAQTTFPRPKVGR